MSAPIQFLHKLCKTTFRRLSLDLGRDESRSINLNEIKNLMNKITAKDVGFDALAYKENGLTQRNTAPVSYMELYREENSHIMAIFVVKAGECLPLHDHPGMYGLMKVIHGNIKITSYTETEPQPLPQRFPVQTHGALVKTVYKNPDIDISATHDCYTLTPKEQNFHEIQPLTEFAAFLDILVPPYGHRGCHYFQELEDPSSHQSNHKWLLEIPEPETYYCDVLPYTGPKLS